MCDGLPPSAWRELWRTARKAHHCCACAERIEPGHRYHFLSGVWDGSCASFKHCARCWAVYLAIREQAPDAELLLDCGEDWVDLFGGALPTELAELAFVTPDEGQGYAK